jgi:hypothetical protein
MKRSLLPALTLAFAAIAFTGCDNAITPAVDTASLNASRSAATSGDLSAARLEASPWHRAILPKKDEASATYPEIAAAFQTEATAFSAYMARHSAVIPIAVTPSLFPLKSQTTYRCLLPNAVYRLIQLCLRCHLISILPL